MNSDNLSFPTAIIYSFEYDDRGYLSGYTRIDTVLNNTDIYDTRTQVVTYKRDAANRISEGNTTVRKHKSSYNSSALYTYGNFNELQQVEYRDFENDVSTTFFTYASHRHVEITFSNSSIKFVLSYNEHSELSKMKTVRVGENGQTETLNVRKNFVYDDKVNPILTIKGLNMPYCIWGFRVESFSKHNALHYEIGYNENGYTQSYDFKPEYNSSGYVTKSYVNGRIYYYEPVNK